MTELSQDEIFALAHEAVNIMTPIARNNAGDGRMRARKVLVILAYSMKGSPAAELFRTACHGIDLELMPEKGAFFEDELDCIAQLTPLLADIGPMNQFATLNGILASECSSNPDWEELARLKGIYGLIMERFPQIQDLVSAGATVDS